MFIEVASQRGPLVQFAAEKLAHLFSGPVLIWLKSQRVDLLRWPVFLAPEDAPCSNGKRIFFGILQN